MQPSEEDISREIKRTADGNGATALGKDRFEKETGIKPYDWGKYLTVNADNKSNMAGPT